MSSKARALAASLFAVMGKAHAGGIAVDDAQTTTEAMAPADRRVLPVDASVDGLNFGGWTAK